MIIRDMDRMTVITIFDPWDYEMLTYQASTIDGFMRSSINDISDVSMLHDDVADFWFSTKESAILFRLMIE